ncbi:N-acetylmuramoyl-L-alanine amidase [Aquisalibacillus elongatus]|uniref:N-acetylmuramoyl-L-alanine amidase n=1 Tax=Aquisalibacillus elongatus TaxID=485577 RepID=A0A3N5BDQ7_9BACI|nr:N-acetylmuramoyl-L-alanine amidase [Aquisalibacillus elongatus]RPF53450.1 N-acetylmuramoyl-L-alanine amidase [Aquisalibacillus elongatus]
MKLYLDPGHGGRDPGASGSGLVEKSVNLDIALRIRSLLNQTYDNVEVKMSRTSDQYKSLTQRTNEANSWEADFYLSIHCNAFNGSTRGYEDYIHSSLSNSSQTAQYRDVIHEEITDAISLRNRGKKKANFHVLRETNMSAMLTENGFIDNTQDAKLLEDPGFRQKVAQGHVNGLAKAFDLKPKETDDTGGLYKIIAGSFQAKENAERRVQFLEDRGIEAFPMAVTISGKTWYRVQAGAFQSRENAENHLNRVKSAGIKDAYIKNEPNETSSPAPKEPDQPEEPDDTNGYAIQGDTMLSPELMNRFVKVFNSDAIEIAEYYLHFGERYGIRGDIAFAQALHETNYFKFTGVVQPDQNNYAGIGATSDENPGASFESPEEGVLAHIQHLYAYATSQALPDDAPLVDPRFDLVTRGSAPSWTDLNGKWAVPGDNYGQSILDIYTRMVDFAIETLENTKDQIT